MTQPLKSPNVVELPRSLAGVLERFKNLRDMVVDLGDITAGLKAEAIAISEMIGIFIANEYPEYQPAPVYWEAVEGRKVQIVPVVRIAINNEDRADMSILESLGVSDDVVHKFIAVRKAKDENDERDRGGDYFQRPSAN